MNKALNIMTDFRCLGNQCPDSCCHSWTVPLDERSTHFLYHITQKKQLCGLSFDDIVDIKGKNTIQAYLKRNSTNHACVLLDFDGLCTIHKKFGHQYLSESCAVYPRSLILFKEQTEETGHLSCPELARLFLTSPHPPSMTSQVPPPTYHPNHTLNATGVYRQYFVAMRALLLKTIQANIRTGLVHCVSFCEKSTALFHANCHVVSQKRLRSLYHSSRTVPLAYTHAQTQQLWLLLNKTMTLLHDTPFHRSLKTHLLESSIPPENLSQNIIEACTAPNPIYTQWFHRIALHFLYSVPYTQYDNLHAYIHRLLIRIWILLIVHAHHPPKTDTDDIWPTLITNTFKSMKVLEHNQTLIPKLIEQIPLRESKLLSGLLSSFER